MSKTQKKIYVASSNATSSSRLLKSVGYFSHCKNLFGKANHALHFAAVRDGVTKDPGNEVAPIPSQNPASLGTNELMHY